jgi:hypothetical protein
MGYDHVISRFSPSEVVCGRRLARARKGHFQDGRPQRHRRLTRPFALFPLVEGHPRTSPIKPSYLRKLLETMSVNGLKAITPVPNVNDFLDIILSSVQRKTPTVIHKNVSRSRCDESCFVEHRLAEP